MRVLISAVMATLALGVPLVGVAETVKYKCEFRQIANKNLFSPTSVVALDLDNWKATVEDTVEMKALGRPVHGSLNVQNDMRLSLSWVVENLPFDMTASDYNRTHKYFYRMSIFSNGEAGIFAETRSTQRNTIYQAVGNCEKINYS